MSEDRVVERFRVRAILALVLICGAAAYAMQIYNGIFLVRDLPKTLSELGVFNVVVLALLIAAALWLYLVLRPLYKAAGLAARGEPMSAEDRKAARETSFRVPGLVITVVVTAFVAGPVVTMSLQAAAGTSYGLVKTIVFLAVSLAVGFATGFQTIVIIDAIIRAPVSALDFHDSSERRASTLASSLMVGGAATALLGVVLLGAAGFGALSADQPPRPEEFLAEALALAVLVALWSLSLFRTMGRTLARRAEDVGGRMRLVALGTGDLSTRVPIVKNDEVSRIASAFNLFLERLTGLTERVRELSSAVEEGAGKLSGGAEHAEEAVSGLGVSVESVRGAVQKQTEIVGATEGEIRDLLASIGQVAERVSEQSLFMSQSSAAVSEMAANIASVSRIAEKADSLATALQQASEEGGEALRASIASIAEIDDASRAVRDIIGVISKIAAQTNLLAMNAAIEAAHAGDSGRGFAVVADEVRSLAENSARSAKEIEQLIRGMAEKTGRGAALGDRAGEAFERIREGVAQTSDLVRTIAASMGEQREGAEEILRSSQSLADATRRIEALAEGQRARSAEMGKSMERIVSASDEIFEAVQEETGATQALGRIVAIVGEEAERNRERVIGLEEAVSRFKTGGA